MRNSNWSVALLANAATRGQRQAWGRPKSMFQQLNLTIAVAYNPEPAGQVTLGATVDCEVRR